MRNSVEFVAFDMVFLVAVISDLLPGIADATVLGDSMGLGIPAIAQGARACLRWRSAIAVVEERLPPFATSVARYSSAQQSLVASM